VLISLSVTGEPESPSAAMAERGAGHTRAALVRSAAARAADLPSGPRCQPWSVSSLAAADVERVRAGVLTDETKSFFVVADRPVSGHAVSLRLP
jgi:hypothetical protein